MLKRVAGSPDTILAMLGKHLSEEQRKACRDAVAAAKANGVGAFSMKLDFGDEMTLTVEIKWQDGLEEPEIVNVSYSLPIQSES